MIGALTGTGQAVYAQTDEATTDVTPSTQCAHQPWQRSIYLKTNAVAWAFAVANAEVEVDVGRHLSVDLPVMYSAWNYFQFNRKYRTLSAYPGVRYWPGATNNGFFAGIHAGVACYNVAFEGQYRTQDQGGDHPALGGGLQVGYRLPMGRTSRWSIEVNVGAGVYHLHHDKFTNDHANLLVATERKTYFGLDQLSLSVCYRFPQIQSNASIKSQ